MEKYNRPGKVVAAIISIVFALTSALAEAAISSVSISGNPSTPVAIGTTITLTATQSGGSNPEYRFYQRDPSGPTWTMVQEYSSDNTVDVVPTSVGTWVYEVWCREVGYGGNYEKWKNTSYVVNASDATVTETWVYSTGDHPTNIRILQFDWIGDASSGAIPSLETSQAINGYVFLVDIGTGSTQPTDLYDITLTTTGAGDTIDIMGGALTNLSASGSESRVPKVDIGANIYGPRYVSGKLTFNLSNNVVPSANGTVKIYITR